MIKIQIYAEAGVGESRKKVKVYSCDSMFGFKVDGTLCPTR